MENNKSKIQENKEEIYIYIENLLTCATTHSNVTTYIENVSKTDECRADGQKGNETEDAMQQERHREVTTKLILTDTDREVQAKGTKEMTNHNNFALFVLFFLKERFLILLPNKRVNPGRRTKRNFPTGESECGKMHARATCR